jgi:LuxR family maltose regulon positive regulatory protein
MKSSKLYAMVRAGQLAAVRESLTAMTERERDSGEIREVLAAVALAEGDGQSAVEFLAPTLAGDAELHHRLVLIRSLLLDAQAREALGDQSAVDRAVERALELAESDSLVLPFMYTESRQLLDRHPRHSTAHGAFLAETLDVLSGRRGPQHRQPDALSDELTEAETRILGFLPTNLPVAAIAAEIYLSANTVKTHMRHIYAKLGAHSRVEAVDKARTLGLLGRSARLDRD